MKRLMAFLAAWLVVCVGCTAQQVAPVGRFATMKQTSEHCNGYSVELWKAGNQVYGLMQACSGLSGDVPTGKLEHVSYDAASGKLTFDAKLTLGSDYTHGAQVDSQDFFSFDGKLGAAELTGKLTHEDRAYRKPSPTTETVKLPIQKGGLTAYPNADAWQTSAGARLKNNGPKW